MFDQIAIGSKGGPAKTTMTPAYMSYTKAFNDGQWGQGAAIAFILFGIIVLMTLLQRLILGEADATKTTRGDLRRQRRAELASATAVATQKTTTTTGGGVG